MKNTTPVNSNVTFYGRWKVDVEESSDQTVTFHEDPENGLCRARECYIPARFMEYKCFDGEKRYVIGFYAQT